MTFNGTYTITLTATDAFGNESSCSFELTVDTILGVEDRVDFASLTMCPNPAKGVFYIDNPTGALIVKVNFYSMQGQLVREAQGDDAPALKVDISNLASSVYIVRIIGANGQESWKQLIVE
ncbi:MAG: T9SS type A sorting domain-containing protein [Flavobacteriaceae bacterium]|nr:T9SS type A sorting domain-containing protein [Flavobacteriaceae bacterium]